MHFLYICRVVVNTWHLPCWRVEISLIVDPADDKKKRYFETSKENSHIADHSLTTHQRCPLTAKSSKCFSISQPCQNVSETWICRLSLLEWLVKVAACSTSELRVNHTALEKLIYQSLAHLLFDLGCRWLTAVLSKGLRTRLLFSFDFISSETRKRVKRVLSLTIPASQYCLILFANWLVFRQRVSQSHP